MTTRTTNMLIAALGGEGGGVLTNWLIDAADRSGWHCQSTSLAGVAQRTGATIYYLEFIQRESDVPAPVMSLFPAQGDIDIAVTSEIAEAGRMLSRGFISPGRTTLISSDHRVFDISEKSATTDGTIDTAVILDLAERYTQRFVRFDINELVKRHGTVISAGLFGAIAGAEVLPFEKSVFLDIVGSGKGAQANLAAFEESYGVAKSGGIAVAVPEKEAVFTLPEPRTKHGRILLPQIAAFPSVLHEVCYHAVERLLDYQDQAYAQEFLHKVTQLISKDSEARGYELTRETARWLALWMTFEDIPRVAQLKLRPDREDSIREEVQAAPNQILKITEFFHPRVEEVAAMLPPAIGKWLLNNAISRRVLDTLLGPRKLRTDTITIQLILRGLASLRHVRKRTLGYADEHTMIDSWYRNVTAIADYDTALALASCGRMVKGYGATRSRTTSRLMAIIDLLERGAVSNAQQILSLYQAAMTGEEEQPFYRAISQLP